MPLDIPDLSEIKTAAREAMQSVFDTWKRDTQVTVYKTAKDTLTVVDPNYRGSLGGGQGNTISKTAVSSSFDARVIYERPGEKDRVVYDGGSKLSQDKSRARVTFEADGHAYLSKAERVVFLNDKWKMVGDVKKLGIMGDFQFYEYIFEYAN